MHLKPVSSCTNAILHGWLKEQLEAVLATMPPPAAPADATLTCATWETWQDGLAERFTLPVELPPLRMLLVWDNLTGHKNAGMVLWLCQHGIMPLYTPLGGPPAGPLGPACSAVGSAAGRWLNMAEAIQRILKRRALTGSSRKAPRRSAPGSSRRLSTGTGSRHHSCGVASAGSGDAAPPRVGIGSVAPQLVRTGRCVGCAEPGPI